MAQLENMFKTTLVRLNANLHDQKHVQNRMNWTYLDLGQAWT